MKISLGKWFMGYRSYDRKPPAALQPGKPIPTRFRDVFEPGKAPPKATPLPGGKPPRAYDGQLLGPGGQFYKASSRYDDYPGFTPSSGKAPTGVALFVNGVGGNPDGNALQAQQMADATGAKVIGFYNATESWLKDAVQTVGDRVDLGENAAVTSLAATVYERVSRGEPTRLLAHSQGALISSRALEDVRVKLAAEGLSAAQVERKLSLVSLETFGGAARVYPDGPRYTHYVNRLDPVTLFSGWALGSGSPVVRPGKDAQVHAFTDFSFRPSVHAPELYLKHYQQPAVANREASTARRVA